MNILLINKEHTSIIDKDIYESSKNEFDKYNIAVQTSLPTDIEIKNSNVDKEDRYMIDLPKEAISFFFYNKSVHSINWDHSIITREMCENNGFMGTINQISQFSIPLIYCSKVNTITDTGLKETLSFIFLSNPGDIISVQNQHSKRISFVNYHGEILLGEGKSISPLNKSVEKLIMNKLGEKSTVKAELLNNDFELERIYKFIHQTPFAVDLSLPSNISSWMSEKELQIALLDIDSLIIMGNSFRIIAKG